MGNRPLLEHRHVLSSACSALRGSTPGKWKRPVGLVWPAISCLASSMRSQWAFTFTEAFILPLLATEAPKFVESFLGLASGSAGEMNLGALAAVYTLVGVLYMLGGLLFGIATFRAGILPRWAAGLLASAGPVSAIFGFAGSTSARPHSGGAGGVSSGLAGLCALV